MLYGFAPTARSLPLHMTNMNYQLLGRSGLRVSDLCLGTMTFGEDWGWGAAKEEARKIYDAYRDAGGNFIDTANLYTGGSSEQMVGEFIAPHRAEIVLATKYSLGFPGRGPNAAGNARKNMVQEVEASLKRLSTDYLDLYWLHAWDGLTPAEEVMRAFDDLVRAGKVLYVGISDSPAWVVSQSNTLAELRGWTRYVGLADRVQPAGTHRRARVDPDGKEPGADRAGLGAAPRWLAHGQISGDRGRNPPPGPTRVSTAP